MGVLSCFREFGKKLLHLFWRFKVLLLMTSGAYPLTQRILVDGVQNPSKRQIIGGEQMHVVSGNKRHGTSMGDR